MDFFTFLAMGGAPGGGGGGMMSSLVLFVPIILIFYFMIIRPQQKRMKEHKAMLSSVERGDSVTMTGGMHGKVFQVNEGTVLVEIAKNTVVEFEKGAIQSILKGDNE